MTSFFEHQKLSFRKNYLRNLIALASADGHLDESERKVIFEIGKQRNLKPWQVEELLAQGGVFEVFIPESFLNRMNLLYDLMKIIYADGVVDENEIAYTKNVLVSFNLSPSVMAELLVLFRDGTPSAESWREFTESLSVQKGEGTFLTVL